MTSAETLLFRVNISKAERVAIERQRLENIANLQKIARQKEQQ